MANIDVEFTLSPKIDELFAKLYDEISEKFTTAINHLPTGNYVVLYLMPKNDNTWYQTFNMKEYIFKIDMVIVPVSKCSSEPGYSRRHSDRDIERLIGDRLVMSRWHFTKGDENES